MGFRKIETLSCLLREGLWLKLECECGHIATIDPLPLRSMLWRKCRSEQLRDLSNSLRCQWCRGNTFAFDYAPRR
jgi:hypothetical protein